MNRRLISIYSAVIFGSLTLVLVFSSYWVLSKNFRKNVIPQKNTYFEVRLVNHCLLLEKYFFIEVEESKKRFFFQNGIGRLSIDKNSFVKLKVLDRYSDYFYSEDSIKIKNNMVFSARCRSDTALREALKSIRKAFR